MMMLIIIMMMMMIIVIIIWQAQRLADANHCPPWVRWHQLPSSL